MQSPVRFTFPAFALAAVLGVFSLFGGLAVPAASAAPQPSPDAAMQSYKDLHHGLFFHYIYIGRQLYYRSAKIPDACWEGGKAVANLDELADNLDIPDLVKLCETARAQYVIFTVFHANINVLYPSKVMAKWLPGHTSKRDVIGELARALKEKGIRVILYFHPSDAHDLGKEDQARLDVSGFNSGGAGGRTPQNTARWNDFTNELLTEILERYGKHIDGFFIDGGLPRYVDAARLRRTIKSANPGLWIIQNAGLRRECADFAFNENTFKTPFPVTTWMRGAVISGDWRALKDGRVKTPIDAACRYLVLQAAVAQQLGGGVSWSFGPYPGGKWEPGVRDFAKDIGAFAAKVGDSVFNTRPSTAWVTRNNQPLLGTKHAALDSKDGTKTYLHVFLPPEGKTLRLPAPANKKQFRIAKLFADGTAVAISQDANGVSLTLPDSAKWDPLDTIFTLE
ncbi:MAG: alpha-L-fucosidase [Puniceicoccales bacterium]|jgi:hypothetical protein|nr:alpha-L-fucosidase [Puniceicoccales bacterium]